MKQKKTKKKEKNKLLITAIVVLVIIAIIGGSTYAYWSWQTATDQQTNVTVTVKGGTLNISGDNVTATNLIPTTGWQMRGICTSSCLSGTATVTAVNGTETDMKVNLKLRATLTSKQGTLNGTNKAYLKWVVEVDDGVSYNNYTGTLANATTNTDIDTGITFTVPAGNTPTADLPQGSTITNGVTTTTRTVTVYVWLDKSYTFTNTGDVISDPMQDLDLSVKWSPASTMEQISLITFTIDGTEYQAEEGMSFMTFANSEYNKDILFPINDVNDRVSDISHTYLLYDASDNYVLGGSYIQLGEAYTWGV